MSKPWITLANGLEEFCEAERRTILVERTEHDIERDLETLIELGEFARVMRVCQEALAKVEK